MYNIGDVLFRTDVTWLSWQPDMFYKSGVAGFRPFPPGQVPSRLFILGWMVPPDHLCVWNLYTRQKGEEIIPSSLCLPSLPMSGQPCQNVMAFQLILVYALHLLQQLCVEASCVLACTFYVQHTDLLMMHYHPESCFYEKLLSASSDRYKGIMMQILW